jgi:predicted acylesterase/phospholipase RssA
MADQTLFIDMQVAPHELAMNFPRLWRRIGVPNILKKIVLSILVSTILISQVQAQQLPRRTPNTSPQINNNIPEVDPLGRRPGIRIPSPESGPTRDLTYIDATFEGGGALGTAYTGTLKALDRHDIWFERVAGNSAGAITAAMIAVGYTATEIEWITAPQVLGLRRPPSLPEGINRINFMTFIDLLTAGEITDSTIENSIFHQLLSLEIFLNDVPPLEITLPPVDDYLDEMVDLYVLEHPEAQLGRNAIKEIIRFSFRGYPNEISISLGEILSNQRLREEFATQLIRTAISSDYTQSRQLLMYYGLVQSGGIAKGDVFEETVKQVLGNSRVAQAAGSGAGVTFRDLTTTPYGIPLAVLATNVTNVSSGENGGMEVYSSLTTPNMSVVEAVRRSMSVPFVFAFREGDNDSVIVDGGLSDNLPFWLFTEYGEGYVENSSEDLARDKFVFILEDTLECPDTYRCGFSPAPAPPAVSSIEEIIPSSGNPLPSGITDSMDMEFIVKVALPIVSAVLSKEQELRKVLIASIKDQYTQMYFGKIPMIDFHWLDFGSNTDVDKFRAMSYRGWEAAIDVIMESKLADLAGRPRNPYLPPCNLLTSPTNTNIDRNPLTFLDVVSCVQQ